MDPQSHGCQEGDLGLMLAVPYKASSGRGELLIKWTNSRFKWKTRTSRFFFTQQVNNLRKSLPREEAKRLDKLRKQQIHTREIPHRLLNTNRIHRSPDV